MCIRDRCRMTANAALLLGKPVAIRAVGLRCYPNWRRVGLAVCSQNVYQGSVCEVVNKFHIGWAFGLLADTVVLVDAGADLLLLFDLKACVVFVHEVGDSVACAAKREHGDCNPGVLDPICAYHQCV